MSIYTDVSELTLKKRLDGLFSEWKSKVNALDIPQGIKDSFVTDGFYPGYLSQKVKVLFVGRESLSVDGDFMECLFDAYREGRVGGRHLNACKMHYLQFYIAYGFNHAFGPWRAIPSAVDLAKEMGEKGRLSFAFINVSKFSNWSNDWQLDQALVSESLNASRQEQFLARQIEILRPDVICSLNALGMAGDQIGRYDHVGELSTEDVSVHDYRYTDGTIIPLLDMWHFSAPRKSQTENYYHPLARKYGKLCERYPTLRVGYH